MGIDAAPENAPTVADADLAAVISLLAEALAPDDGRSAKVERLMTGLCRLVDADAWVWIRTRFGASEARPPSNIDYLRGGGFDDRALYEYADWSLEVHGPPPENVAVKRLVAAGEHWTRARPDLVDDPT